LELLQSLKKKKLLSSFYLKKNQMPNILDLITLIIMKIEIWLNASKASHLVMMNKQCVYRINIAAYNQV